MGADAHDTRTSATVRPHFTILHEEIYATLRPPKAPRAGIEGARAAHSLRKKTKQPIELV
jgi:hypothetical protein